MPGGRSQRPLALTAAHPPAQLSPVIEKVIGGDDDLVVSCCVEACDFARPTTFVMPFVAETRSERMQNLIGILSSDHRCQQAAINPAGQIDTYWYVGNERLAHGGFECLFDEVHSSAGVTRRPEDLVSNCQ